MKPYYEEKGITIYHGDCRDVLPCLAERPALVLTDPPYGVRERTERNANGRSNATRSIDWLPVAGDGEPFNPSDILSLQVPSILWGANHFADRLPPSPSWLTWDKRDGTAPDDNADCEFAWTNLGGPARLYRHLWRGMIKASEREQVRVHPTQKPVALMRWCLLRARLTVGALVVDPYMGSGPIAQACKELGMRYIGIEIEERYCEIAARRLSQEVMDLDVG